MNPFSPEETQSLTQSFCKQYSKIKLHNDAKFEERMEFDIYKRNTKNSRQKAYETVQTQKLSPEKTENLFDRLVYDTKLRASRQKHNEDLKVKNQISKTNNSRKISLQEANKLYSRLCEANKKIQIKIEQKRKEKQEKEERDFENMPKIHKKHAKSTSQSFFIRINADIVRRKEKIKSKILQKETEENEQVFL